MIPYLLWKASVYHRAYFREDASLKSYTMNAILATWKVQSDDLNKHYRTLKPADLSSVQIIDEMSGIFVWVNMLKVQILKAQLLIKVAGRTVGLSQSLNWFVCLLFNVFFFRRDSV